MLAAVSGERKMFATSPDTHRAAASHHDHRTHFRITIHAHPL